MNMQVFNYESNKVRIVNGENGEPWFVAKDVCDILELTNPTEALKALDDDEKMTLRISEGHSGQRGGAQSLNAINESGLYTLIMRSNKPEAKKFRKWVTSEVLPSIRKTGGYSINRMSSEDIQFRLKELDARNKELDAKNRELDMRGAEIIQRMLDNPPFPITPETQTVFAHEIFRLSSGHNCLAMLPTSTEKWYTATDIGKEVGLSANKVGRITNAHGIKAPEGESNEYGQWIFTKSQHSDKEVSSFIYNEKALKWFKEHIEELR